ncbi:hypothetical protein GVAV_002689 [Gurleya vavrai]
MKQKKQKSSLLKELIAIPSCCSLGLLFCIMDCVSYGRNLLPPDESNLTANVSMFIFLLSTFVAQITYGFVTSIPSGIIAETIIENFIIYNKIFVECKNKCENINETICNTLICVFLGTMLFSFITFLLMKFNLARILKIIPKSAITGCLGAIGISQFEVGVSELHFDSSNITKIFIIFICLSILFAFTAFLLSEKLPQLFYIVPLFSVFTIAGFYAVSYYIFKKDLKYLIKNTWLSEKDTTVLLPNLLLIHLKPSYIKFSAIFANISNIISLALFSLIHLPINLPVYSIETKIPTNFQKELKTQSIANFFTAFCFSPTYFICSNSIFFRRSGGTKKIHSLAYGFLILIVFYYGTTIRSYIPCICLAMFPFFFGISICYSAFFKTFSQCKKIDYSIIFLTAIACYLTSMEKGILVGTFLNTIWFMNQYLKSLKSIKHDKLKKEALVIDYILCFATLNKFENNFLKIKKEKKIVFDMRNCFCVDWLARDFVYDLLAETKEFKIEIVGVPIGFDKKKLEENGAIVYENESDFFVKSR